MIIFATFPLKMCLGLQLTVIQLRNVYVKKNYRQEYPQLKVVKK